IFWEFLRGNKSAWKQHAEYELGIALGLSLLAIGWIIYSLWRLWEMDGELEAKQKVRLQLGSGMLHLFVLLPLLVAAVLACRIYVSKGRDFWNTLVDTPDPGANINAWVDSSFPSFVYVSAGIYAVIALG